MELNEEYYRRDFDNTELYKLRGDGHLFKFEYTSLSWDNVSSDEEYDISWEPLEKDELIQVILQVYMKFSFYTLNKYFADTKKPLVDFGTSLSYFYNGEKVGAIDNKGNEFICHRGLLELVDKGTIDDEYEDIAVNYVIDAINDELGKDKLSQMTLYFDNNNDIQAFSDNGCQYRLSKTTGDLLKVYDGYGLDPSWKKTSYSMVQELFTGFVEEFSNHLTENNYNYYEYISQNREKLNGKLGKDIFFYDNGFHDFYAMDENNNEFICNDEDMLPITSGTIDTKWERVNPLYLIEYLRFYEDRRILLEKGGEVTLYDLKLSLSTNRKLIGQSKEGKEYMVTKEGDLVLLENEGYILKESLTLDEAVRYRSIIKNKYFLNEYIDHCENLLKDQGIEIDDSVEFFCSFGLEFFDVFLKDGNGQEFLCEPQSMKVVEKGTIKDNFTKIADLQVLALIKACFDAKHMDDGNK